MMDEISDVTRQDIIDVIRNGFVVSFDEPQYDSISGNYIVSYRAKISYHGRLNELLWCAGIIMQKKGIVIFMDNQLLQIQNRTCRIYGTASAEYLLLQMVDEHDLAGMEREVEAIHRQTAQPFCWPLSK